MSDTIDCPICGGGGEIMDSRRIWAASLDQPMTTCPACAGCGTMDADLADRYEHWDARDFARARAEAAAEERWEREQDR